MKKHDYEIFGNTAHVFIKYNGETYTVKVDIDDLNSVLIRRWHMMKVTRIKGSLIYAQNRSLGGMHRYILDAPKGLEVDHINRDTLDNRKCNLRLVTSSENKQNYGLDSKNRSGIKNVKWSNQRNKWQAGFQIKGKHIHVGFYDDISDAKEAVEVFRAKYLPFSQESMKRPDLSRDISELKDRLRSDNTSGFKGINWDPRRNYWRVRVNEKEIYRSPDLEEAKKFLDNYKKTIKGD